MSWIRVDKRAFKHNRQKVSGRLAVRLPVGAVLCAMAALFSASAFAQSGEQLRLSLGQSVVVNYPEDIRQIHTTDDKIADVNVVSTREMLVLAKGIGTTDIVVWSASNNQPMYYNVTVGLNIEALRRMLRETFPGETIELHTAGDSISLNGVVSKQEVADRAAVLAGVVAKNVVNNLKLPVSPIEKQVMLRVKFAELDRQKASDLGVNLNSLGALGMVGGIGTGALALGPSVGGSNPSFAPAFNIQAFRKDLNLEALIKALQTQSILQVLSEPTLVTSNKQEASFLVGGEFPIPIPQGGTSNAITIQFREFGIRLKFTPDITTNDTIRLKLSQEVSSIDTTVGISYNGASVPGLSTRRAETLVELGDGQSFIVAGLLDNQAKEQFSKIPGIGNIPILGALFKAKSESKNNRELIMLVTPEITTPMNASDKQPELDLPLGFLKGAEDDLRGPRKPVDSKPPKSVIKK